MVGVPILGILGLLTWESQEKWHLGVSPMANHKKYYKREGSGFLKVQVVVSLVSSCMHVAHLCTKSVPIMH